MHELLLELSLLLSMALHHHWSTLHKLLIQEFFVPFTVLILYWVLQFLKVWVDDLSSFVLIQSKFFLVVVIVVCQVDVHVSPMVVISLYRLSIHLAAHPILIYNQLVILLEVLLCLNNTRVVQNKFLIKFFSFFIEIRGVFNFFIYRMVLRVLQPILIGTQLALWDLLVLWLGL